jgi:heavy metal translocating P-type ATPase
MERRWFETSRFLARLAIVGFALGGVAALLGAHTASTAVWLGVIAIVAVPLALEVARSLARRKPGVDAVALLAMLSCVAAREIPAAAVVAVMVSGGLALERYAAARAKRDLSVLLSRSPRIAHRREHGEVVPVDADDVRPGDRLIVKHGETVPVDGFAVGTAVLDESTLTGESVPAERSPGDRLRSGAVNAGPPFDMDATATAGQSTFAAIVRLAREAETRKAPFVRMADRYAGLFLPVTLLAAASAWALSGDSRRAVAVLVVATPCPLLLAAPVALVSGISRAARRGILVKGGQALEGLSRARVLLLDKTGTITVGAARVAEVAVFGPRDPGETLRLAAALDQMSNHVFAASIVRAARERGMTLPIPEGVTETPGFGVRGTVLGIPVAVGKGGWVAGDMGDSTEVRAARKDAASKGMATAFVAIEGRVAGAILLEDPVRPDALRTIRGLRAAGIRRVVVVTGDHRSVAESVGARVGADEVLSERSATEKVDVVRDQSRYGPTVMVGDGVNDAPALAQADVGVALGATGSAASSESADVVVLVDRLDRLRESIEIAKRSMAIAKESVVAGMALSFVAMVAAGAGLLPPLTGAILQEGIDIAVILNALRALRSGRRESKAIPGYTHPDSLLPEPASEG